MPAATFAAIRGGTGSQGWAAINPSQWSCLAARLPTQALGAPKPSHNSKTKSSYLIVRRKRFGSMVIHHCHAVGECASGWTGAGRVAGLVRKCQAGQVAWQFWLPANRSLPLLRS
ncbi:uncharacterized protein DMAD_09159 [Drosophila madeirensis]|uniref:Uncharacterized protein n=1 Tax=Drosophila madeirensis TaxID=30013 RepID=A0AAU9F0S6_DROMD